MDEVWHFLPVDGCLRYGERSKVVAGETLRVEAPPVLCKHGFHGSVRALDALSYAPGPIVQRAVLSGHILRDDDKMAATERTCLWLADATRTLHEFALWCAEEALQREREVGRAVDPRSEQALEVKRRWLADKATYENLSAARDAARGAVRAAANAAARVAARGAARDTAWAAAWDAAKAAWDAANAAAWAAAWDAARDAAGAAVWDAAGASARDAAWGAAGAAAWSAAGAAARDAAWGAAWATARDAQNTKLTGMLVALND